VDRTNDRVVAVKQLDKAALPKRGVSREDIERECKLMKAVTHCNITELFDYYSDNRSIYLVLEYCDGGDFGDKVKERGMSLQETEAADWMAQICSAILALNTKNILHRDIKPDNFMVAGVTLKLADFGLACFFRGKPLTDKCGTPAFMAPEQIRLGTRNSRGYGYPVDMWAAGLTMYMLMFGGRHPFVNGNQLDENMLLQGRLDFRQGRNSGVSDFLGNLLGDQNVNLRFSDAARNICTRMVEPNDDRRITAQDALKDHWLANAQSLRRPLAPVTGVENRQPNTGYPPQGQPGVTRNITDPNQIQSQQRLLAEAQEKERRIKSLEHKVSGLQDALSAAATNRVGPLPVNTRCRYYSGTYGWLPGFVQCVNEHIGTFNLDVRQQAAPDKICPPERATDENDVWPNGTWVWYQSTSLSVRGQSSLPGVVTGFNPNDNTYNLDVREHAAIDRIRARLGSGSPP